MKRIKVLLLTMLLVFMVGCGEAEELTVSELLERAEAYLSDEEYESAVEMFNEVLEEDPFEFEAYMGKIEALGLLEVTKSIEDGESVGYVVEDDGKVTFYDVPKDIEEVVEDFGEAVILVKEEEPEVFEDKKEEIVNAFISINYVIDKDTGLLEETTRTVQQIFGDGEKVTNIFVTSLQKNEGESVGKEESGEAAGSEDMGQTESTPGEEGVIEEEPEELLTEEQKAELEAKQKYMEAIDTMTMTIEEQILSYYETIQNNPIENGLECLQSDIYYNISDLYNVVVGLNMYDYVDDRCSISMTYDENGFYYLQYIFTPEGCEGNEKMGFYYTDNAALSTGGRGKASRLGDAQWKYGVYYGEYDGDVRSGKGVLCGYTHRAYSSGSVYSYSGEWANDLPNGSGNWELQFCMYDDRIKWYEESASVVAEDGRFTGSFNVDICDKSGNTVKGIYEVENGRYIAVDTNTYVLEKQLKKKMGPDDYAYCVCYNNEGHGSLVLWRHYDESEPSDHWTFSCTYDRDFDN